MIDISTQQLILHYNNMSKSPVKNLDNIDWGETEFMYKEHIMNEVSVDGSYECIYPVRNGDIVLAIGESIGPFTWSIMDKAKTVIALEPSKTLYPTLVKNCRASNTILLNKAFGGWDHVGVVDDIWLGKHNEDNKWEVSESVEVVCLL